VSQLEAQCESWRNQALLAQARVRALETENLTLRGRMLHSLPLYDPTSSLPWRNEERLNRYGCLLLGCRRRSSSWGDLRFRFLSKWHDDVCPCLPRRTGDASMRTSMRGNKYIEEGAVSGSLRDSPFLIETAWRACTTASCDGCTAPDMRASMRQRTLGRFAISILNESPVQ